MPLVWDPYDEYKYGLLIEMINYKLKGNQTYQKVTKEENEYEIIDRDRIFNMVVAKSLTSSEFLYDRPIAVKPASLAARIFSGMPLT